MAPEVQQRRVDEYYTQYAEKVDIYSMTVSLWEMLTRRLDQNVNPHSMKIRSCPPFLERLFARGMAEDPAQRPEALQLVQMLDFIMRKVCIMNTSQLYIDFDSGGIPSVYQQAPTHPVDSNTVKQQDSSYYSLPEEMMTVQVSDPRPKVIPERSPGDGQEPRRYVTTDATLFNRPSETDALDLKMIPLLLRKSRNIRTQSREMGRLVSCVAAAAVWQLESRLQCKSCN
ncbi:hypothetical protein ECG_08658 [Echinococcus granulosus]|nr:hypothetical protein ECG_08658 [Echinococcus granulosus]